MRLSNAIPGVLVIAGAGLVLAGLFAPWDKGSGVPYAPGDNTSSARTAELTSRGYTSGSVTVYEGRVSVVRPDVQPGIVNPNYTVTLSSGAPDIYLLQEMDSPPPPALSIGENIRVWSVIGEDADGATRVFAVRLEAGGVRWVTDYFGTPVTFQGGSNPVLAALALGGVPGGMAVVMAGLAVPCRRSILTSNKHWRRVDLFNLAFTALSILTFAVWFEVVRYTGTESLPAITLLLPVLPITGIITGIAGVATRKPQDRLWPSLVGIIPGALMLLAAAAFAALMSVGGCRVIYC